MFLVVERFCCRRSLCEIVLRATLTPRGSELRSLSAAACLVLNIGWVKREESTGQGLLEQLVRGNGRIWVTVPPKDGGCE